ncbi:wax ester/triacylglycerol synthase domain-containing protein [Gordonia sp. NPDC003424]
MRRLAPADALFHWLSDVIPNDQFLLYCFADQQVPLSEIATDLRRRSRATAELSLRVLEVPATLDRPYWVERPPSDDQIVVHPGPATWQACLDRLGDLTGESLDATRAAWRVHLFGPIADPPMGSGAGVVVVLQICHALGDGRRASQIARMLFSDNASGAAAAAIPVVDRLPDRVLAGGALAVGIARLPVDLARTIVRGAAAYRAAHAHPPRPSSGVPPTRLNRPPGPDRLLRTIVGPRDMLPTTHPVTVGALTAVSLALGSHLGVGPLAVELTIGRSSETHARNNFRNVGIDLHTELDDVADRADAIDAEIARARTADADPVRVAERRASDASPAALTHWGVGRFDVEERPETMIGVTVVSSVHRGPADLTLAGGKVLCTAGFPALSPAQGLTHGVHGIGDTVTLSVTTSPDIMSGSEVDAYVARLIEVIRTVRQTLSDQVRGG